MCIDLSKCWGIHLTQVVWLASCRSRWRLNYQWEPATSVSELLTFGITKGTKVKKAESIVIVSWQDWEVSLRVSLLAGKKKNRLRFMHVLLNLQGLHSRSYILLVILLVYLCTLSAKLWLLFCSPSYRLHTSISQTSTIISLCATDRRIQQQEKWLSSSSQQKNWDTSGWQPM